MLGTIAQSISSQAFLKRNLQKPHKFNIQVSTHAVNKCPVYTNNIPLIVQILHWILNSIQMLIHDLSSIQLEYRITENGLQKGHSSVQLCKICRTFAIQMQQQDRK